MDNDCIRLYDWTNAPTIYRQCFYGHIEGLIPTHLSIIPKDLLYMTPDTQEMLYIHDVQPLTPCHVPVETRQSELEGYGVELIYFITASGDVLSVMARVEDKSDG